VCWFFYIFFGESKDSSIIGFYCVESTAKHYYGVLVLFVTGFQLFMLYAWWHVAVQWLAKNVHNCIGKLKEEEEEEEEAAAAACNGSSHICLSICRWCINQKNFPPIRQFSLFKFGNIVTNLWSRGLNNQSLTTTGTN